MKTIKHNTKLGDTVVVSLNGSIYEGLVTSLTGKGLVIKNQTGSKFYKWDHVQTLKKKESVLFSTTTNNGYGCSCCGRTWDDEEWITEDEMDSFSQVIDQAMLVDPLASNGGIISYCYGNENDYYYGYDVWFSRNSVEVYIWIDNEKYPLKTSKCDGTTKEDLLSLYIEKLHNKGGSWL